MKTVGTGKRARASRLSLVHWITCAKPLIGQLLAPNSAVSIRSKLGGKETKTKIKIFQAVKLLSLQIIHFTVWFVTLIVVILLFVKF